MALRALITVLAIASGVLHLALDMVLFRGNFGFFRIGETPQGPPPGAGSGPPPGASPPPQLPLPLNQLFFLNFVGWIVLVLLFWFVPRGWAWLVDVAMIVYTLAIFGGWLYVGSPNPMNLGYLSKAIEVLLLIALGAHLWSVLKTQRGSSSLP